MNPYILIAIGVGLFLMSSKPDYSAPPPPPTYVPPVLPSPEFPSSLDPGKQNPIGYTRATVPWPGEYINPQGYKVTVTSYGRETWVDSNKRIHIFQNPLPDPRRPGYVINDGIGRIINFNQNVAL